MKCHFCYKRIDGYLNPAVYPFDKEFPFCSHKCVDACKGSLIESSLALDKVMKDLKKVFRDSLPKIFVKLFEGTILMRRNDGKRT